MRTILLIPVTVLLPLVWGWGVYCLLVRLWPAKNAAADDRGAQTRPPGSVIDYQI